MQKNTIILLFFILFSIFLLNHCFVKKDADFIIFKKNSCGGRLSLVLDLEKGKLLPPSVNKPSIKNAYNEVKSHFLKSNEIPHKVIDLFHRPVANMLFSIVGLDDSIILQSPNSVCPIALSELLMKQDSNNNEKGKKCSSSTPALPKFVSLLTGQRMHSHKIYSSILMDKFQHTQKAFGEFGTFAEQKNLLDMFLDDFPEASLISVSSNEQFLKATTPIKSRNNQEYLRNPEEHQTLINRNDKNIMRNSPLFTNKDLKFQSNKGQQQQQQESDPTEWFLFKGVKFNFKEDLFLTELHSFEEALMSQKNSPRRPSLFLFTFYSLRHLAVRYGIHSDQYREALQYLSEYLPYLMEKSFVKIFPKGRVAGQVVLLGGLPSSSLSDVHHGGDLSSSESQMNRFSVENMLSFLKKKRGNENIEQELVTSHFPVLYTKKTLSLQTTTGLGRTANLKLCQQIQEYLKKLGTTSQDATTTTTTTVDEKEVDFTVYCRGLTGERGGSMKDLFQLPPPYPPYHNPYYPNDTNETYIPSLIAIADWQAFFWVSVFIAVSVYLAVYVISVIETNDITSYIVVDIQENTLQQQ